MDEAHDDVIKFLDEVLHEKRELNNVTRGIQSDLDYFTRDLQLTRVEKFIVHLKNTKQWEKEGELAKKKWSL